MKKQLFISYAKNDQSLMENFAGRLKEFNIDVWIYSRNKTLSVNLWKEIKEKILSSSVFIYAISQETASAKGQIKELDFALRNKMDILPIAIDEDLFHLLPDKIKYINGDRLSSFNVKEMALKIANRYFDHNKSDKTCKWYYPVPGDWLEVKSINKYTESDLDIGDLLLFRKISPLGLFECYSPKLNGFYWIAHEDVKKYIGKTETDKINSKIPYEFSTMKMIDIEERAWRIFLSERER